MYRSSKQMCGFTINHANSFYTVRSKSHQTVTTLSTNPSSSTFSLTLFSLSICRHQLSALFSFATPPRVAVFTKLFADLIEPCGMTKMPEKRTSPIPSSSEPSPSSSSALQIEAKEGLESDDEIRKVPELGVQAAGASASSSGAGTCKTAAEGQSQKKRGRSSADKENKRLKRLLRNRVSAQQARERKKAYLNDLEARLKELEKRNSELEEKLSTLTNENQMLRQILKNTTSRRGGIGGSKPDGC